MDDNNDLPRVTRSRNRRLSTLDVDSRPLTPLLDATANAERAAAASPRPLRRTRLNSATIDLRTPTRTTRLSVARGETPEPQTPTLSQSAVKRATRTPAKSAKSVRNLKLQEDVSEEPEPMEVVNEVAELVTPKRVKPATTTTVQQLSPTDEVLYLSPTDERRVTRSMSKTPPVAGRSANNTPQPQAERSPHNTPQSQAGRSANNTPQSQTGRSANNTPQPQAARSPHNKSQPLIDLKSSPEEKQKPIETKHENIVNTKIEIEDAFVAVRRQSLQSDADEKAVEQAATALNLNQKNATPKLQMKVRVMRNENQNAQAASKIPKAVKEPNKLSDKEEQQYTVTTDTETNTDVVNKKQLSARKVKPTTADMETVAVDMDIDENQSETTAAGKDEPTAASKDEPTAAGKDEPTAAGKDDHTAAGKDEPTAAVKDDPIAAVKDDPIAAGKDDPTAAGKDVPTAAGKDVPTAAGKDAPTAAGKDAPTAAGKDEQEQEVHAEEHNPIDSDVSMQTDVSFSSALESNPADKDHFNDEDNDGTALATDGANSKAAASEVAEVKSKSLSKFSLNPHVTENIRLPDLTPKTKSRVVVMKNESADARKTVAFNNGNDGANDGGKARFPKTPARLNAPPIDIYNLSETRAKSETPLKSIMMKGRNSSTPLAVAAKDDAAKQPPAQIDVIKPFAELENKERPKPAAKVNLSKLELRLKSDDEDENEDEENDKDDSVFEYFDNEVEVVDNYQSGESMDSTDRRNIEENEIPHDGESVGSQDTTDEHSEEEDDADEMSSFIVSDNDVSDHNVSDNDDDEQNSVCFSSSGDDSTHKTDSKGKKKRRRIVVHDSSDDEDEEQEGNVEKQKENKKLSTVGKEMKEQTTKANKSINKSKIEKIEKAGELTPTALLKPNKLKRLNKTAPTLTTSVVDLSEETLEVASDAEEVLSSSDESDKKAIKYNKTILEVLDSDEESNENYLDNSKDDKPNETSKTEFATPKTVDKSFHKDLTEPSSSDLKLKESESEIEEPIQNEKDEDKEMESTSQPEPVAKSEPTSTFHGKPTHEEETALPAQDEEMEPTSESVPVGKSEKTCKSSTFHGKQTHEEEAALLAQLTDLSHLQPMFNPLQKSRRQTLYTQGHDLVAKDAKQKLKRRSEILNSDVQPSQSFIETLAQQKTKQSKRKRLSKSFCGAADGLEETTAMEEAQRKKAKKTDDDSAEVADFEIAEPAADVEINMQPIQLQAEPKEQAEQAKSRDYYIDYCDSILQAANEAKLLQKKQRVATGRKPKSRLRSATAAVVDVADAVVVVPSAIATDTVNCETDKPKVKKDLKRLQTFKKAIKHAMQLLDPAADNKEPKSLARKLSPQPEMNTKAAKSKQQTKKNIKPQLVQVSPLKSSDEENHQAKKRFRNRAGFVEMSFEEEPKEIELIKLKSGICKVEPCTPKQKYFREIPGTPVNRSGFQEMPSKTSKNNNKPTKEHIDGKRNPATEAALRFKKQIFGRSAK